MPDLSLSVPLADSGREVPPGTVASAHPAYFGLPEIKNYALDESVRRQMDEVINPIIFWSRVNRTQLEEEWRTILRMEMMLHDNGRRYMGRSIAYLPIWARSNQSTVSALSRGLFPSAEYMNVYALHGPPESAQPLKAYMQWEFDRVARVRTHMKPFLRQLNQFGNTVLKFWYHQHARFEGRSRKHPAHKALSPSWEMTPVREGLRVSAPSMLFWYIYPTTATSLDDATVIFEDIDLPRAFVEDKLRQGKWVNAEAALNGPPPPNHLTNQADQHMNIYGLTPPSTPILGQNPLGQVLVITECYAFLRLPKDAYIDGVEDPNEALPCRIMIAGNTAIEVIRNPYWHQRPPYVLARTNVQPGLVYGYGSGRMMKPLQYLANDFMNQTNDCGTYALNPVAIVNPNYAHGPLRPLAPGVTWQLTDVNEGVKFHHAPVDLIEYGYMMLDKVTGLGNDLAGTPPVMQGTGAGKGARTATQAQILQRNVMAPLQDVVEDIELDALTPLMYGAHIIAQQYRDKAVMARVAGQPVQVNPEDLAIDADFQWLASSQAVNQAQRAQQAMQLMQAVAPLVPLIGQAGYVVNFVPLIDRVYSDGFGFRDFQDFIRKAQQVPGALQPAQNPANPQAEQTDNVRSALEQVANMIPGEMVPGEGEDFADVRDQADEMAAQAGGMNGKQ